MLALLLSSSLAFADAAAGCDVVDLADMDTWACLLAEPEIADEDDGPPIWLDAAEQSTTWTRSELARIPAGRSITEVVRMSPGAVPSSTEISNGWAVAAGGGVGPMMVIVDGVRVGPLPPTDHAPIGRR